MREILFRGKNAYDLHWVYGYCVKQGKETYIFEQEEVDMGIDIGGYLDCCRLTEVVPETVGQYTGLTDKNGTKIFEGDILSYIEEIETRSRGKETLKGVYEVKFEYCGFSPLDCLSCNHLEIIGNILDNPDLLKGGDQSEAY